MLILVGVTVNVALNGGLFETANKAAKQTQKEADREILQAAVIAALNEQLIIENANAILKNLPDGWEVTGADGGPYTCTSPKGNVFIVDQNGEITIAWVDNRNGTFTKGDTTVEIGKTYTKAQFEELLKKLGIIEEYTGAYTGDWQVIGLEGGKLKLVSTGNVRNNVKLGKTDENLYKTNAEGNKILKDEIVDLNGDKDLEFEKGVWSYAHAVDTLDEVAQKATGITLETTGGKTEARSVNLGDIESLAGLQDSDKVTSIPLYLKEFKYEYSNPMHKNQVFVKESGEVVSLDSEGKEVTLTYTWYDYDLTGDQEAKIGTLALGDSYWLATSNVQCYQYNADFNVFCMDKNLGLGHENLFGSRSTDSSAFTYGVRAVVSI